MSVDTVRLENRAIRLAHDGYSLRQIVEETGLGPDHLHRLFTSYRTHVTCDEERCGQPQTHPGHPRKGWVQIRAGHLRPWFCGLDCALRWITARLTAERSAS